MEENKTYPEALQALIDGKTDRIINPIKYNCIVRVVPKVLPGHCVENKLYRVINDNNEIEWTPTNADILSKKWKYELKKKYKFRVENNFRVTDIETRAYTENEALKKIIDGIILAHDGNFSIGRILEYESITKQR